MMLQSIEHDILNAKIYSVQDDSAVNTKNK